MKEENIKNVESNKINSKKKSEEIRKRKTASMVGFAISITLFIIAISMSINQKKENEIAKMQYNESQAQIASVEISKNVNEVKEKAKNNNVNKTNNVNSNESISNNIKDSSGNKTKDTIETSSSEENVENQEERTGDAKLVSANVEKSDGNNAEEDNKNENFIMPVEGEVTKQFSMDSLVYSNTLQEWITHRGIDIKGEMYEDVKASKSGKIKSIKNDPRFGTSIIIEHDDGFKTVYSCLLGTSDGLEEGKEVKQGDVIGKMGNSGVFETADGVHLHFEMLKDNEYINPEIYLK